MRSLSYLIVASSLVTSLPAFAKAPSKAKKAADADDSADTAEVREQPSSSRDVRGAKSFGLAATFGAPGAGIAMPGVEAYYLLDKDWEMTAFYGQTSFTSSVASTTSPDGKTATGSSSAKLQSRSFNVGARRFFGNSFYGQGNIGTNWYKAGLDFDVVDTTTGADQGRFATDVTMQTVFLHLGIGNQWSFASGFFIDCQWLGYGAPVIGGYTYKVTQTGPTASADTDVLLRDASDDLGRKLTKQGYVSSNLALGWAF